MTIHVLPEQLASQIAAGEVVERPASVVKELVENAIDAGATTITINIRDGGRQLVQVADNGAGIPADEIETAFLRHATSKLNRAADLNNIHTLGFRGEALAAIAAVSRATIVTRTAEEAAGTRLELEAGKKTSRETVGAPLGTVIAVENLFHNVPARLKFLKAVTTEKRHIDEFVTRCAMAFPDIRFRLSHNNRVTFQTSGNGSLLDVLATVYGPDTARQLLDIEGDASAADEKDVEPGRQQSVVSGLVGPPSLHWSNRNHITLFVNGRWIKDSGLSYAVIQAYHTLLPTGRYPLGIVFLNVPYDEVDVNVHPAKTEVRFRHRNAVFSAVQRAVRQTLVAGSPVRSLGAWASQSHDDQSPGGWPGRAAPEGMAAGNAHVQSGLALDWRSAAGAPAEGELLSATQRADLGGQKLPIMRVVGQVGAAYIVTEGPDGIFLIDQHAAHERILYEQFMAAWASDSMASQRMVTGAVVHLSPSQASLLEEHLDLLARLGFEVEPFGPNAFKVRALPAILVEMEPARGLVAVVEDLERGEAPLQGKIEERIIMRVCKTAAVKAGQALTLPEMEAMIRQLEKCRSPHTCPHGRPTLIHLSVAQLAREFGRA